MSDIAGPVQADERLNRLLQWTSQTLGLSPEPELLVPLTAEAGFRRYYRVGGDKGPGLLAVDADPATEDSWHFVAMAHYLRDNAIHTPDIHAVDLEAGFLLVEDLGDDLLYRQLRADPDIATANRIYGSALTTLLVLQQCPDVPDMIPRYDQPLLRRELEIFSEWFVSKLLEHPPTDAEAELLQQSFERLEQSALEQPSLLVHRDYHSRNLLRCADGSLGVIDFQGALWGPCTYDLVSLLKDCYLQWPRESVRQWAWGYGQLLMAAGLIPAVPEKTWLRWFDWMGLQRHLKVLGIFARLHLRDNKSGFLADLPRVLAYVLEVLADYPELAEIDAWFHQVLMPLISRQPWYRPQSGELAS